MERWFGQPGGEGKSTEEPKKKGKKGRKPRRKKFLSNRNTIPKEGKSIAERNFLRKSKMKKKKPETFKKEGGRLPRRDCGSHSNCPVPFICTGEGSLQVDKRG